MLDHLNERMQSFLRERRTVFIGCTNNSPAPRIWVRSDDGILDVLGSNGFAWDESVDSKLWELTETASHATLMAIDWEDSTVGFHLNGSVTTERTNGRRRCMIDAKETYIHCAKHIPRLGGDPRTVFDDTKPISPDADLETFYNEFIAHRICFMLGTADTDGETDISSRFGPQRFVQLTERGLAYPEYQGN